MIPESLSVAHHGRVTEVLCWWPETTAPSPAVIVSHGYNGHGSDTSALGQALAASGIAALCLSFSGGSTRDTSGFPSTGMTLYTERDDILAVLDWAKAQPRISSVFLYGESMGGMASVLASAEAPEQIAGLGLLYPALCIADNWRKNFPSVHDIPETVDFWNLTLGRVFFTAIRELDIFSLLPRYQGPALIMHGTDDPIVPLEYSEKAASLYCDADLHVFPGEGHGFSPDGAKKVCELLTRFVLAHAGK